MEQQKKDKILALVTTIVLHIVVLFVLWLTFLGKEPVGTGSGVLVQVGFVDESAGMFESNADRPEQTEAERPRENEDELLTQTDEESIHIEKKEEKKDKTIQENKKDERIANQVKNAFGKGVSNDGSRGDSDEGSGTQGNPFGNSSTGEITGVGGYGGYNLGGRGLVGSLPYPEYDNSNDAGIIAISITVDPQGKVISAIATVNGSKGTAFSNRRSRRPQIAIRAQHRFLQSNRSYHLYLQTKLSTSLLRNESRKEKPPDSFPLDPRTFGLSRSITRQPLTPPLSCPVALRGVLHRKI